MGRSRETPYYEQLAFCERRIAELEAENAELRAHPITDEEIKRDMQTLMDERNRFADALVKIANWPDSGNNYGQGKIKRFAEQSLALQELVDAFKKDIGTP